MKPFVFRLERVLQLRVNTEKDRARDLASAQREAEALHQAYRESLDRLTGATLQLRGTPRELSTAGTLQNLELTVVALATLTEEQAAAHRDAQARVEEVLHRFEEARLARRTVERLRERREDDWNADAAREDRKAMDEIGSRRTGKGRGEGE